MEGVPVVGGRDDIFLNVDKYHINQILLAIPTATPHQKRDILNICKETGCELKQLPGVYQLVNGEVSLSKMKKVAVEDLLGRDTIKVNICKCKRYIENRNRHRIRSCTIRKRSRQQRKCDPAVQAPD